jgi:pyruvate/2-oxoglutarate dehydrogenase complex dihydrolipoamide acyltransferase (E2) component
MPVPITTPDLGTARGRVSLWFVGPGERVYEGDRIVELLIPGATVDVPAPATGIVTGRAALPGDAVTVGQELGTMEAEE